MLQKNNGNTGKRLAAFLRSEPVLKVISLMLVAVLAVSAAMTGTYAWRDEQHKTNIAKGGEEQTYTCTVILQKYEKDLDGNITAIPVPNAQFLLFSVKGDVETQVGDDVYVTNASGHIILDDLPLGDYYFQETNPGYGYTYDKDAQDEDITKYYFTVTESNKAGKITAVTVFNRRIANNISLSKTVVNSGNVPLTPAQLQQAFVFTVVFDDGGTYSYTIGSGAAQQIASGGTITLRHGETAIISGVPVGVQYTITEAAVTGYTQLASNAQGNVQADAVQEVTFTNTCDYTGSLEISKTVTGEGAETDKDFQFTVQLGNGGTYYYRIDDEADYRTLVSGEKITLRHGQTAVFPLLPDGLTFTVTEDSYTQDGYITAVDQYMGAIVEDEATELLFTNQKQQEEPQEGGSLVITKEVVGKGANKEKPFQFTVTFSEDGDYTYRIDGGEELTLTNGGKITLKHGQKAVFENLPAGLRFSVVEDDYRADGYFAKPHAMKGHILQGEETHAHFFNKTKKEKPDTTLIVKKIVIGEVAPEDADKAFDFIVHIGNEVYTFSLKNGESKELPLPFGAHYTVREKNYYPDGFVIASLIHGNGVGLGKPVLAVLTNASIKRELVEIQGEKTWDFTNLPAGMTAEEVLPKFVTVWLKVGNVVVAKQEVKPNDAGKWIYKFSAPKYDKDGKTPIVYTIAEKPIVGFETTVQGWNLKNTYVGLRTQYDPVVKKKLYGDAPETQIPFSFLLEAIGGAPMPQGGESGKLTCTITGAGEKSFGNITFTKAGVYVYRITEVQGAVKGYTFDTSVYTLKVTVVESAEHGLVVESASYTREGDTETYRLAEFINEYKKPDIVEKEKVKIAGYKTWIHGDNAAADYPQTIVVLIKAGGKVVAIREISARDEWKWEFSLDKFDDLGNEIVYTVDENAVADYEKTVDGYNIVNKYVDKTTEEPTTEEPTTTEPGTGEPTTKDPNDPKTGDDATNTKLWAVLLFCSLVALVGITSYREQRKRKQGE